MSVRLFGFSAISASYPPSASRISESLVVNVQLSIDSIKNTFQAIPPATPTHLFTYVFINGLYFVQDYQIMMQSTTGRHSVTFDRRIPRRDKLTGEKRNSLRLSGSNSTEDFPSKYPSVRTMQIADDPASITRYCIQLCGYYSFQCMTLLELFHCI